MKFLRHLLENPFITFTGLAALVHSTWSLGTLFSGVAPSGNWWDYAAWVIPAFFIAFAMDVGQISTSAKIRHNGLSCGSALAFFVFSVATYYLQFLYIAHHMPALAISAGVSPFHQWAVVTARDAAIWILPLLLPLSTMLYTISDGDKKEQAIAPTLPEPTLDVSMPTRPLIEEKVTHIESSSMLTEERIQEPRYLAECADCGWHKDYEDVAKASRALRTHQNLHCSKRHELQAVVIGGNGHVE